MQFLKFSILVLFVALVSCDSKPKVIEAENTGEASAAPIFSDEPGALQNLISAEHTVVVEEVLNTERYAYLRVKENDEEYWVAISKREIKVGEKYAFKGGLLKKNFQSKEYNRIFETLYLVSDFRELNTPQSENNTSGPTVNTQVADGEEPIKVTRVPGAIKIAEVVKNAAKYEGKAVKVTGKCMKINPMIMGRNWVHLQDGSGKDVELTITTNENIPIGHVVTLEGTIATNKDFGAGYKYDVIMEGAVLK